MISSAKVELLNKMRCREATVSVIGIGYAGLPLAVAFAEAGFRVIGVDTDATRVAAVNRGESYIQDIPSETLAHYTLDIQPLDWVQGSHPQQGQRLTATTSYEVLHDADVAIVCVPTPLSKTKEPDLSHVMAAADEIARRMHRGMLIVLESTTYPGTTEEIILPRLQHTQRQTFQVGTDFFLAFSPERIDPGNQEWVVSNTPKVVGGVTPHCLALAQTLYGCAIREVVPVSSCRVAEMVKLLENTFRATNIALVNEVAIMCGRLGMDVWEVIEAAKTKPFGFMPFYPGPGLGGHCLPIGPQYLAWKLRSMNYHARFIQLAEEINFGMPAYVLGKIADALNAEGKPLKDARVLVLGVAYKANVADLRESPALDLIHLLHEKGAVITYHDPYVPQLRVGNLSMDSTKLGPNTLQQADCVVITTAHKSYDWKWLVENSRLVVDTRNATGGMAASGRVVRL